MVFVRLLGKKRTNLGGSRLYSLPLISVFSLCSLVTKSSRPRDQGKVPNVLTPGRQYRVQSFGRQTGRRSPRRGRCPTTPTMWGGKGDCMTDDQSTYWTNQPNTHVVWRADGRCCVLLGRPTTHIEMLYCPCNDWLLTTSQILFVRRACLHRCRYWTNGHIHSYIIIIIIIILFILCYYLTPLI